MGDAEMNDIDETDMFLADLDGIFDDDGPSDTLVSIDDVPFVFPAPPVEENPVPAQVSSAVRDLTPISIEGRRRRASAQQEGGTSPPGWHSEAADKAHRQHMIHEVARLLHARKTTQPSQEWLQQLPHKTRKLEERLYWSAPSLEAYLDKTTLKSRLRRVAMSITRKYKESKLKRKSSIRSSASSQSSDSRYSFSSLASESTQNSIDSLASLRQSVAAKAQVSTTDANAKPVGTPSAAEIQSSISALRRQSSLRSSFNGGPPLESILETKSGHSANITTPAMNGSLNIPAAPPSASATKQQQPAVSTGLNISELERQKKVNEKLQQQILENIRRQEELVRQLQAKGSKKSSGSASAPAGAAVNAGTMGGVNTDHHHQQQQRQQQRQQLMASLQQSSSVRLANALQRQQQQQQGNLQRHLSAPEQQLASRLQMQQALMRSVSTGGASSLNPNLAAAAAARQQDASSNLAAINRLAAASNNSFRNSLVGLGGLAIPGAVGGLGNVVGPTPSPMMSAQRMSFLLAANPSLLTGGQAPMLQGMTTASQSAASMPSPQQVSGTGTQTVRNNTGRGKKQNDPTLSPGSFKW